MLFMHFLVRRASRSKYFSLGKPVVNTRMSGSEMIRNIFIYFFLLAGVQVMFVFFFKDGESAEVEFSVAIIA